jgi:hypothetical protein
MPFINHIRDPKAVTAKGRKGNLWLVIFMDDIDSPDLEVHARSEVIQKFQSMMKK